MNEPKTPRERADAIVQTRDIGWQALRDLCQAHIEAFARALFWPFARKAVQRIRDAREQRANAEAEAGEWFRRAKELEAALVGVAIAEGGGGKPCFCGHDPSWIHAPKCVRAHEALEVMAAMCPRPVEAEPAQVEA